MSLEQCRAIYDVEWKALTFVNDDKTPVKVKVSDLKPNSMIRVHVTCDNDGCDNIVEMSYQTYTVRYTMENIIVQNVLRKYYILEKIIQTGILIKRKKKETTIAQELEKSIQIL